VLFGLLFLRGLFYYQIGPAVNWTPRIHLGIVALAFRGNVFTTSLLFSILSFVRTWMVFHFWLLTLAIINGRSAETNPFHKLVLVQLGRVGRAPRLLQAILPVVLTTLLWIVFHPALAGAGVVRPVPSFWLLVEQGALLGAVLCFTLKTLLPIFLFVHLVASYIYLGPSLLWDYVALTSRRILRPLRGLPLRLGRVDFAPLVGMILILLLLQALPSAFLKQFDRQNLTLWPQ
jgi:uncharacterized protein YggT (Ycf19 family)